MFIAGIYQVSFITEKQRIAAQFRSSTEATSKNIWNLPKLLTAQEQYPKMGSELPQVQDKSSTQVQDKSSTSSSRQEQYPKMGSELPQVEDKSIQSV